jgi:hypothetical protein
MRRLMARTGSPVDRSVLHALGLSGILMERLFILFLLLFIHLGVFVACDNGNQERELRLLSRIIGTIRLTANKDCDWVATTLCSTAQQRRGRTDTENRRTKRLENLKQKEELETG